MPKITRKLVPQTGPYILTRRGLNPSARILARELGLEKSFEPRTYPPTIRWGNSDGEFTNDFSVNHREIIRICGNKLRFSQTMSGLNIPHVEIRTGRPERFPVVVRHNLSASRGIGIEVINQDDSGEFLGFGWRNTYWSYWRNFSMELGVHIFDGRIIKLFKKVSRDDTPSEEFPIRNASRGWGFSVVNVDKFPKLIPLINTFCSNFGMTFGRLDVGWNDAEKKYEIIEANSAPSLSENENTASLYVQNLKTLLER